MDPSSGRRKVKYAPKPKAWPQKKRTLPKTEANDNDNDNNIEDDEAVQAETLMTKFNANLRRPVPKIEKKSSVQVAFGPGATSSTLIRQYGVPRDETYGGNSRLGTKGSTVVDDGKIVTSHSTANEDGEIVWSSDAWDSLPPKIKKGYKEPWDYHHSYYPTTLPLRRPYSGDPELLNVAEFGKDARNIEYDEKTINPASDLGLLEECNDERMFFFQLPSKLPLLKRSASVKGKERAERSMSDGKKTPNISGSLGALPGGYVGKMFVYRSGAVKLKLGDVLYDVSPGSDCIFAQDVMAINTADKHCCAIRELGKRAVVTPDVNSLLNSVIDLG